MPIQQFPCITVDTEPFHFYLAHTCEVGMEGFAYAKMTETAL